MIRPFFSLLSIALATLLSACPIWVEEPAECRSRRDCPAGHGCYAGACEPETCASDRDCPGGQVCDTELARCITPSERACMHHDECLSDEACIEDVCTRTGLCTLDDHCLDGTWCVDGRCLPHTDSECRTSDDCATTELCVADACRDRDEVCQFNYECGTDRVCVNNECSESCETHDDCPRGTRCDDGLCRPFVECESSADCAEGIECMAHRCMIACSEEAPCLDTERCAEDGYCQPDTRPRPFCMVEEDCAAGHVCHEGVCRTPCPTGTTAECRRYDSQFVLCADDGFCYSSHEIAPECATPYECTSGQSCIDASCR